MRQRLLLPADQERVEQYMEEYGPLRLVKSSAAQIVRSASSILAAIPTLAQTVREHSSCNPEEVAKLKKDLEDKDVGLSKKTNKVNQLLQREAEALAGLKKANEMLLQRDQDLTDKQRRLEEVQSTATELEKKLRLEILDVEDAAYEEYRKGFDQAIAQVKHFNHALPIDTSRTDIEKNLDELLEESVDPQREL